VPPSIGPGHTIPRIRCSSQPRELAAAVCGRRWATVTERWRQGPGGGLRPGTGASSRLLSHGLAPACARAGSLEDSTGSSQRMLELPGPQPPPGPGTVNSNQESKLRLHELIRQSLPAASEPHTLSPRVQGRVVVGTTYCRVSGTPEGSDGCDPCDALQRAWPRPRSESSPPEGLFRDARVRPPHGDVARASRKRSRAPVPGVREARGGPAAASSRPGRGRRSRPTSPTTLQPLALTASARAPPI
jgi:hypothetical protein